MNLLRREFWGELAAGFERKANLSETVVTVIWMASGACLKEWQFAVQKKGRARSSAEVQQGGMKVIKR